MPVCWEAVHICPDDGDDSLGTGGANCAAWGFRKKSKEVYRLIRDMGTKLLKAIIKKLNGILAGYHHYYGITDNIQNLDVYSTDEMIEGCRFVIESCSQN